MSMVPHLRHVLGLDLGQVSDFTALALLQWDWPPSWDNAKRQPRRPSYRVPTLKRWPIGTPYLDVVAWLVRCLKVEPLASSPPVLVVDATGVGEAVCEMIRRELALAGLSGCFCAVTITCGSDVTLQGNGRWRVAKKQLVSVLQVLLGSRRLQVAHGLESPQLMRELGTFTVKISEAANESFDSWRERDHDDLVLAVALGAWFAEWCKWPLPPPDDGLRPQGRRRRQ
jgi:hypothetical protein